MAFSPLRQVVEAVNASQKRNAMIFNALFQLHTAVTNLLPVIPPSAMEYIDDALKQLARYHCLVRRVGGVRHRRARVGLALTRVTTTTESGSKSYRRSFRA
jgi:hypothetical protein